MAQSHVYIEVLLLIGTAGAREPQGAHAAFAIGAMTISLVWFTALGYGARLLAPLFRKATARRVLDAAIGSMVLFVAATQCADAAGLSAWARRLSATINGFESFNKWHSKDTSAIRPHDLHPFVI